VGSSSAALPVCCVPLTCCLSTCHRLLSLSVYIYALFNLPIHFWNVEEGLRIEKKRERTTGVGKKKREVETAMCVSLSKTDVDYQRDGVRSHTYMWMIVTTQCAGWYSRRCPTCVTLCFCIPFPKCKSNVMQPDEEALGVWFTPVHAYTYTHSSVHSAYIYTSIYTHTHFHTNIHLHMHTSTSFFFSFFLSGLFIFATGLM